MTEPMPREPVTRGHATFQSAYPPSEETFAGDIMLRLAGGVWEDTDEIRDHFVETAEDIDDYYPDGPASADDVPAIFDRVLAEYRRVVTDVSYDAAFLTALPELLLSRGIVMSWGDGFDTGEAVEYAAELAEVARDEGYSVRGGAVAQLLAGKAADRWGAQRPTLVAYGTIMLAGLGLFFGSGHVMGLFFFGVLALLPCKQQGRRSAQQKQPEQPNSQP